LKILPAVLFSVALAAASEDDSFLIRNITVHTVSGGDIQNGSILVRDGKIVGVGAKLTAPKGTKIIEGKSLHVYPGLIDSGTNVGLQEIGAVRETNDFSEIGDFNPQLRTEIAVNPASEHIPVIRANGITTVMTLPDGGMIDGQGALIHLDGWTWQEMAVLPSAVMHINFPVLGAVPTGLRVPRPTAFAEQKRAYDAKLRELHEFFEQTRRYQKAKAAAAPDFQPDLKFEAMLPVLEGKLPLMVSAVRERAIRDAVAFADKERIHIVLAEVREPGDLLKELKAKNIPVILGPTLSLPLEEDSAYDSQSTLPNELYKAGVKFAFATFSTELTRNLPYQAANAVAFGLPYTEALKAVTINAAEIWGVSDRIGSIDEGKWADLVITDGDPLEAKTQIKQLFIKGKPVDLDNKQKRLYEKYLARP
jgi:imidazolonepropionase-like amidohydrolase